VEERGILDKLGLSSLPLLKLMNHPEIRTSSSLQERVISVNPQAGIHVASPVIILFGFPYLVLLVLLHLLVLIHPGVQSGLVFLEVLVLQLALEDPDDLYHPEDHSTLVVLEVQ
jgi:hypothetical protein